MLVRQTGILTWRLPCVGWLNRNRKHLGAARKKSKRQAIVSTDGTVLIPILPMPWKVFYIDKGGFLRKSDLAAHVTLVEDPVTVDYRGYTVHKCGTWTQGPYLCQALRLLEGFDLKAMGNASADYVHVVTEALKLAMADRDAYYGDPEFVDVPLSTLLSDAYTEIRRPLH